MQERVAQPANGDLSRNGLRAVCRNRPTGTEDGRASDDKMGAPVLWFPVVRLMSDVKFTAGKSPVRCLDRIK